MDKCHFLAYMQTVKFKDISGFWPCSSISWFRTFISFNQDVYGTPGPSLKFLPERVLIRVTWDGLIFCQSHIDEFVRYINKPVTKDWGVPLDQSCAILLKQPLHLHLTLLHWTFLQVMSLCCPYYFKWCLCFVFWDLLREFKLLEGCWYSMWWSSCVAAKS